MCYINVRESRSDNQAWIIHRHKTKDEDKQNTKQHSKLNKMGYTEPPKIGGWT